MNKFPVCGEATRDKAIEIQKSANYYLDHSGAVQQHQKQF